MTERERERKKRRKTAIKGRLEEQNGRARQERKKESIAVCEKGA
jgi:hypothetical protein